jgi:cytochrome c peroxidase/6-phosphogluconolactonase (cycloisomerase 2 family)
MVGAALLRPQPAGGKLPPPPAKPEPHRSPCDLALLPGGDRALTANHTANTVSLVDLARGRVLAEKPCGAKPVAVACSPDAKVAAVSNLWDGTISFFRVGNDQLKPAGTLKVGAFPRALVFAPDGKTLYAAVAGADEVVAINPDARKITRRWPAPREPRQLALSPDGRWLAAASSRSAQVRCWDTRTGKRLWERTIEDGFNLAGLVFTPKAGEVICTHVVRRAFPVSRENIDKGWVIDSRLTRFTMQTEEPPFAWQIALDTHGKAVGDPQGGAFSPDGKWFALTGAGTHELLLLETAAIPWTAADPGDFIDPVLKLGRSFRRVYLGGRPMKIAYLKTRGRLVVANYLLDAVQIVDTDAGKVVRTIPLGAPTHPSLARQGEALFYDARRSHNQWFSCHTCHVDGHTCGLNFDTLNDDTYGNPKLTPTLRNVANTGPWTWHGWQKDLGAAVEKSLTQTMFGPKPTRQETQALVAFLKTLRHPPHPHRGKEGALSPAARRGQALFTGKARCARCHQGDNYTSQRNYDVGLEADGSPYRLWNPPSLLGLYDRGPFLHDGRAESLDDLLRKHHSPEKLGGQKLTDRERQELIAFLESL